MAPSWALAGPIPRAGPRPALQLYAWEPLDLSGPFRVPPEHPLCRPGKDLAGAGDALVYKAVGSTGALLRKQQHTNLEIDLVAEPVAP